jgi:hypothetical protein
VIEVSQAATTTTDAIFGLQEQHRHLVTEEMGGSVYALPLLDFLFEYPIVSMRVVTERLGCTFATASKLLGRFEDSGLLQEITGWERNRLYRYGDYLDLFESHDEMPIQ